MVLARGRLVLLFKRECLQQVKEQLAHLTHTMLIDRTYKAQHALENWLVELGTEVAILGRVLRY